MGDLIMEYRRLYPQKKHLILLRALLCYYRMINFRACVLIRIRINTRHEWLSNLCAKKLIIKYGIEVGRNSVVGYDLHIEHPNGIVIGNHAVIGNSCTLYHQVTIGQKHGKYPNIGDKVVLYPGCKIVGNVTIGDEAEIGTNAVVIKDVPPRAIVAGAPATIVKIKNECLRLFK